MDTVAEYLAEFVTQGREEFLTTYTYPFLLYPERHGHGGFRSYHTQMADRDDNAALAGANRGLKEYRVLSPADGSSAQKSHKFLVGRGEDRDLFIDHSTVSKRHAFMIWDEQSQAFKLGDAGSTNGTFLNGQAVESGEPVFLRDSNVVSFGDCDYLFYTPEGFSDILDRLNVEG